MTDQQKARDELAAIEDLQLLLGEWEVDAETVVAVKQISRELDEDDRDLANTQDFDLDLDAEIDSQEVADEITNGSAASSQSSTVAGSHVSSWTIGSSWVFLDVQQNEQGPFPASDIKRWTKEGYFKPTTMVRPADASAYRMLKDVEVFQDEGNRPVGRPRKAPRLDVNHSVNAWTANGASDDVP
eukprot:SAG31_NODE_5767_length_2335_cov_2.771020_3_plen_185_part_00